MADRVLMLGASPTDEAILPIGEELQLLRERLPTKTNRLAELSSSSTDRLQATELTDLLRRTDCDVLHLVGHGLKRAYLAVGEHEQSVPLEPKHFVNVLKLRDPLKLVVLSSCYSGEWCKEFLKVAYAVVAMPAKTYAISAREFSIGLYENLYSGMSLAEAVANATLVMRHLGDKTTQPMAMSRKEFGGTENTYLYQRPELLARFQREPPKPTRDGNHSWYAVRAYVRFAPSPATVRMAATIEDTEEEWAFDKIEPNGEDYEVAFSCWGNTGAAALIEYDGELIALKGLVADLLTRHYAILGGPRRPAIVAAIETLRRDGKTVGTSPPGRLIPRKKAAAKKAAPKKRAAKRRAAR